MNSNWMIYGANGYSGLRAAREAKVRGMRPLLAGRNAATIEALAAELGLPWTAFDLNDAAASRAALRGIAVVAHCAGPFSATSRPMVDACLVSGTHYIDITGEIDVILGCQARDAEARAAGIVVCPAAGFDVLPTDCLLLALKQTMPDATHLTLGIVGFDNLSPGTMKTAIEGIAKATSCVRENGEILQVPYFTREKLIDFRDGKGSVRGFNLPWADVGSAWFSTRVPNIDAYMPRSAPLARTMILSRPFIPLMGFAPVAALMKWLVPRINKGSSQEQLEKTTAILSAEARNAKGEIRRARVTTPQGYLLTTDSVLMTIRHLLDQPKVSGFHTPAMLMGARCVERLPGVTPIEIS